MNKEGTIQDFKLKQTVHISSNYILYNVFHISTGESRSLKVPRSEIASLDEILSFHRDYELGKLLCEDDSNHIIHYFESFRWGTGIVTVLEDVQSVGLPKLNSVSNREMVKQFLEIALKLARALSVLHSHKIFHSDLKPENVFICDGELKLTGFGRACQLKEEFIQSETVLKRRELKYISPEQTGRMNRTVDYRTDFYSLGIVLYELLMGKLPSGLDSKDQMEVIYSHIAIKPTPPHEERSNIPTSISLMVMKLLEKNADSRYQSSYSLERDILHMLNNLEDLSDTFVLGAKDVSTRFVVSKELYGRKVQKKVLLESFDRVSQGSIPQIFVLVAGYSGIGKTSLVFEVQKSLTKDRGYFISGKYDQFKCVPYYPFIMAITSWVRMVLCESEERVKYWKDRILESLNGKGEAILEVVPLLELITGKQPPLLALVDPSNIQSRFVKIFKKFIQSIADKNHPLVIYLDDLQWADPPTLYLLENLMTDPETKYLMLIGAYRSNENYPIHTIQAISKKCEVMTINLEPLEGRHVKKILIDSLSAYEANKQYLEDIEKLKDLVMEKTLGNPFYVKMFINDLNMRDLISFDMKNGRWVWNLDDIASEIITNNVLDLMISKIHLLPKQAQDILALCAIIGNEFYLSVVLKLSTDFQSLIHSIWPSLQAGLLIPIEGDYRITETGYVFPFMEKYPFEKEQTLLEHISQLRFKFLHDRVQQAASLLIPQEDYPSIRLRVGREMISYLKEMNQSDISHDVMFFEILDHMNFAKNIIVDQEEELYLVDLNCMASMKAKFSAAFATALQYAENAIIFLNKATNGDDSIIWNEQYERAYKSNFLKGEAMFSLSMWEECSSWLDNILSRATTSSDRSMIQYYQVTLSRLRSQPKKAIEIAMQSLTEMGIKIMDGVDEILEFTSNIKHITANDLLNQPRLHNDQIHRAVKIIVEMWAPFYVTSNERYLGIGPAIIRKALKYGISSQTPLGCLFYAETLIEIRDYKRAHEWAMIGLAIHDIFKEETTPTYFLLGLVLSVTGVQETAKQYFYESFYKAVEQGKVVWAIYSAVNSLPVSFWGNSTLLEICDEIKLMRKELDSLPPNSVKNELLFYKCAIHNLSYGDTTDPTADFSCLANKEWPTVDEEYLQYVAEEENCTVFADRMIRLSLCNFFNGEQYYIKKSYEYYKDINFKSGVYTARFYEFVYLFHKCIALLRAIIKNVELPISTEKIIQIVQHDHNKLKEVASWNSNAFDHYVLLISAEACFVDIVTKGKYNLTASNTDENLILQAMKFYDLAIDSAARKSYYHDAGLACDLASQFYEENGLWTNMENYFKKCIKYYTAWGASSLVIKKKQRYVKLCEKINRLEYAIEDDSLQDRNIDFDAVVKSCQTISSIIDLKELLSCVFNIILQYSGATRVVFIKVDYDSNDSRKLLFSGEASSHVEHNNDFKYYIQTLPLEEWGDAPLSLLRYIERTQESIIIHDCQTEFQFKNDVYFQDSNIFSAFCTPILHRDTIKGILYLESSVSTHVFTSARRQILGILSVQLAISLENAYIYEITRAEQEQRYIAQKAEEIKTQQGNFINMLCHELRNPLHGMFGGLQYLKDSTSNLMNQLKNPKREFKSSLLKWIINTANYYLNNGKELEIYSAEEIKSMRDEVNNIVYAKKTITECVNHQKCILDDTLHVSKLESNKVQLEIVPFSPSKIFQSVVRMFNPKISNKKLLLKTFIEGDSTNTTVLGDPYRIKQIIINFMSNAIKFTSEGYIRFSLKANKIDDEYIYYSFEVEDTGIGMNESQQKQLFNPFVQLEASIFRQYGGSGLGMAISKGLAELMGGEISVRSKLAEGSSFTLNIKCKKSSENVDEKINNSKGESNMEEDDDEEVTSPNTPTMDFRNLHVLIVDDNQFNRKTMELYMSRKKIDCVSATNGSEAVDLFKRFDFDIIFMDIHMPMMGGFKATSEIRKIETKRNSIKRTPIIALSGISSSEQVDEGIDNGMDDFISKPVKAEEIYRLLMKWTNKAK
eukprot:TRINITY_DN630_c0_g1_i1.p1 TRINITY_DN630_c0_g1~~TRINITY_DN630_c0_g1_i1.p1  ORF type:complete len:2018 (-),score=342.67 TRINITY_DN630_c0_g1_i1:1616-7624(-)